MAKIHVIFVQLGANYLRNKIYLLVEQITSNKIGAKYHLPLQFTLNTLYNNRFLIIDL